MTWAAYLATDVCDLGVEWVLADDSGLEVDALNGAPGVHSARFAALDDGRRGNSSDNENNAKLMHLLDEVPDAQRIARFRCVLALTPVLAGASPDDMARATRFFSGTCDGRIEFPDDGPAKQDGWGGFGYDPLFIPAGYNQSFADLGVRVKNSLSHRGRALAQLAEYFAGER